MIIILGMDGLEFDLVEKWDLKNLKQISYGKTDLEDFTQLRTIILWSSFITGKNRQAEIMAGGDKVMWDKKWDYKETFFSHFKNVYTLDVPSFSYIKGQHDAERALMKEFFESGSEDEQHLIREDFNKRCFDHYKKMKEQFWDDIHEEYDLAMVYFNIADVIGHLNFGNTFLMKMIYQDLDELAGEVQKKFPNAKVLVISDHGMKALGYYGEHTHYSFWSTNWKVELTRPKITAFHDLISSLEKPVAQ